MLTVTCDCRRRYVVLIGVADQGAQIVGRETERRGALFVDVRVKPFKLCPCGQSLNFSTGEVSESVM